MSEPTPPRRPLATFLRAAPADAPAQARAVAGDATAPPVTPGEGHAEPVPRVGVDHHTDGNAEGAHGAREAGEATAADTEAPAPHQPPHASVVEPVFLRAPAASTPVPRWQWGVIAALTGLLLLQIAIADRDRLAADASTRPWIAGLCGVLRCTLPAWHEPSAYTMISREIRPVPGQAGTLQVQAAIRNDARWAQAWPMLKLTLSDADGRVIGSGVFSPRQYLPQGADGTARLEPGQSAPLAFQVREPAASTVAFTFDFL